MSDRIRRRRGEAWSLAGLLLGVTVIIGGHLVGGGQMKLFLQPVALLVVLGGTLAALLVSRGHAVTCRLAPRDAWGQGTFHAAKDGEADLVIVLGGDGSILRSSVAGTAE